MNISDKTYTVIYLGQSLNQVGDVDKSKALLNFGCLELFFNINIFSSI